MAAMVEMRYKEMTRSLTLPLPAVSADDHNRKTLSAVMLEKLQDGFGNAQ